MEYSLTHHGIKGMKWGIRRKRTNVHNRKKKQKQLVDRNTINKGIAQTKRFLKDNGPFLVRSGIIIGLSSVGAPHVAAAINVLGNLDMSSIITTERTVERVYTQVGNNISGDPSWLDKQKLY